MKVRIALAINSDGDWCAYGTSCDTESFMVNEVVYSVEEPNTQYWVEVTVPIPEPSVLEGVITPSEQGKR